MQFKTTFKQANSPFGRWFNPCWVFLVTSLVLGGVIFLNYQFSASLAMEGGRFTYYTWLILEVFLLLTYTSLMIIGLLSTVYLWTAWKEKLFYAFLSFNPYYLSLVFHYAWQHHFFWLQPRKWKTLDYALISLSVAVYLVLTFVCKQLLPTIPVVFLSFSLEYIALFFVAFLTGSFSKTFLTGFLTGLSLLFFPSTYFINFWQFSLDYLVPNLCVSLATIVYFDSQKVRRSQLWTFLTIPYLGIYASRVLGGVFFYSMFTYDHFPVLLYSLIINGINTAFDYACLLALGMMVFPGLTSLQKRYQTQVKQSI